MSKKKKMTPEQKAAARKDNLGALENKLKETEKQQENENMQKLSTIIMPVVSMVFVVILSLVITGQYL